MFEPESRICLKPRVSIHFNSILMKSVVVTSINLKVGGPDIART